MGEQVIGIDIGGSHVAGAVIHPGFRLGELINRPMDTRARAGKVIHTISEVVSELVADKNSPLTIGIAMPGPFNYPKGVCEIHGVGGKFSSCFGLHFSQALRNTSGLSSKAKLHFFNDAHSFAIGAYKHLALPDQNVICITLGTGFGSTFILGGEIAEKHPDIPVSGMFYCEDFKEGIADDYFSTRWFLNEYEALKGHPATSVKQVAELSASDEAVKAIFEKFGTYLAEFLAPWINRSKSTALIIGGNISRSWPLFKNAFECKLEKMSASISVHLCENTEELILEGAAILACKANKDEHPAPFRKTSQPLLPIQKPSPKHDGYGLYPSFHLEDGAIQTGFQSLAEAIRTERTIIVDGYAGVLWERFRENLDRELAAAGIHAFWYDINACLKAEQDINDMISESLNGDDPVFGKKYPGEIERFFDNEKLEMLLPDEEAALCIVYGTGAALSKWNGKLIYLDLPKNEIQYRMRAGTAFNFASSHSYTYIQMYKRSYFVDWPVLNEHKRKLLPRIDIIADEQRVSEISWAHGDVLRTGLQNMLGHAFRARPWFEAGVWGGQWMKSRFKELNQEEINYAWSFELITPENGIVMEHNDNLLEVSFDFLLYQNNRELLGKAADRFRYDFPIRFDFLDTFEGGNLSIQCHPRTQYIREQFGEHFTQDETYYILDCEKNAEVYLGFQDDIDPTEFRQALNRAQQEGKEIDITEYVQSFPASKHDLFLIPNGTIHASGRNNLVLEISSTPYIFTFKMYDWQRLDLTGKPRPINIEHAFNNLYFDRKGSWVEQNLVSKPSLIESGEDLKRYHLPTHPDHFYRIERYEFSGEVSIKTNGQCHIGMLVEGTSIEITTGDRTQTFHYAETFVVPAAVDIYKIRNKGEGEIKLVVSFVKDE